MPIAGKVLLTMLVVGILLANVGDMTGNDKLLFVGTIMIVLFACVVVVGGLITLWFL